MPQETKRTVASFSTHNVSGVSSYNKNNFPANFTGTTNHDGTVVSCDPNLEDNSQNPSAGFGTTPPMVINKKGAGGGQFRDLLPASYSGRIAQYATPWWGTNSHPNIGLNDRTAADAKRILQDMQDRGIDAWFIDWYGISLTSGAPDDSVVDVWVANNPPGMKFFLDINGHYVSGVTNPQQTLIDGINHILNKYASNPAYERYSGRLVAYRGRPIIPFWSVSLTGIDMNAVRAAVSGNANGNPILLGYQQPGFAMVSGDGAWSWSSSSSDTQTDPSGAVSYLGFFLGNSGAAGNQSKIIMTSISPGFNGTLTGGTGPAKSGTNSWSLGKYIARQDGRTWKKWWDVNRDWLNNNPGKFFDYVQTVTWDDYQEGSSIQQGIRVDTRISASAPFTSQQAGQTLPTTLSFSKTDGGDELNVQQYNLWGSLDGVNAVLLASVFPGQAKQFDLTKLTGLTQSGIYTLYVEAQGYAGLQNIMAPQTFPNIQLNVPGAAPTLAAHLNVSPGSGTAPLAVTVSGNQSTGNITNYAFDFGDGSPVVSSASPTAQYTYVNPGTFLVKLTVTDGTGATATTSASIIVSGPPTGGGGSTTSAAPTAAFSAFPLSGQVPFNVDFDASESFESSSGAAIAAYDFDFGDGVSVSDILTAQSHTYTKSGTFLVTLSVVDVNNQIGKATKQITASPATVITPNPNPGLPPPPPPNPPPPTGDPNNPIKPVTPTPSTPPDPRRTICQRFKDRFLKK